MGLLHGLLILKDELLYFTDIISVFVVIAMILLFLPIVPELLLAKDYAKYLRQKKRKPALLMLAALIALETPLLVLFLSEDRLIFYFFAGGNLNAFLLWLWIRYCAKNINIVCGIHRYVISILAAFVLTWTIPIILSFFYFLGWIAQLLLFVFSLCDINRQRHQPDDAQIPFLVTQIEE